MGDAGAARQIALQVGDVQRVPISVLVSPYPSISTGLIQIFPGMRCGLPQETIHRIGRGIDSRDRHALSVMGDPTYGVLPDFMQPSFALGGVELSVEDSIDALLAVPDEVVSQQVDEAFRAAPPGPWRQAIDAPREWIRSVARVTQAAQRALEPVLHQHRMLIDREIDRIGRAVVRGAHDLLLESLYPRLHWSAGALVREHPNAGSYELGGRKIVLVPMVSGMDMLMTNYDQSEAAYIAYPIRHVDFLRRGTRPASPLRELLGAGPSEALHCLARPMTMGRLAVALQVAPATVTGYITRLERLGLATRARTGRTVTVARTTRAAELLELMASEPAG